MSVFVGKVTSVEPHPNSDKLDIVSIIGKTNVANRPAPDQPRYKVGDYAVVLTDNLILPEYLIKHLHMWDYDKNKGGLAGNKGNRTKGRNIGGIPSQVALCAANWDANTQTLTIPIDSAEAIKVVLDESTDLFTFDVSELLGITDYIPQ